MGMCKKCYKKEQCSERDQYGRCTQYRRIDEIRKEIEDLNQSEKPSEAKDSERNEVERNIGDGSDNERLLLGQI